ncbi:DUF4176 domain-containing protein [Dubosiella newyorkensis]|uniref:DUF4176 domain-containing protein n=1 Tax=Dubosiella newyorkensis TaxID=1862672 RepID=UPI00272B4841|nr:DUF4176 domain-containing protein [Dubosiella newyorkensis]
MKMPELLPLGSVVTLKNGDKKIMIIGRFQRSKESGKIYDYAAVLWPEGMIDSTKMYLFDHKDTRVLYYIGLQNEEEFNFRFVLEEEYEKVGRNR